MRIVDTIRTQKLEELKEQKLQFINKMSEVENNENYFSGKRWISFILEKANINTRNIITGRYYGDARRFIRQIQSSKVSTLQYKGLRDSSYVMYRISKFFRETPHRLLSALLGIVDVVAPLLPVFGTLTIVTVASGILVTGAATSIALLPLAGAVVLILGLYAAKKFFIDKLMIRLLKNIKIVIVGQMLQKQQRACLIRHHQV